MVNMKSLSKLLSLVIFLMIVAMVAIVLTREPPSELIEGFQAEDYTNNRTWQVIKSPITTTCYETLKVDTGIAMSPVDCKYLVDAVSDLPR